MWANISLLCINRIFVLPSLRMHICMSSFLLLKIADGDMPSVESDPLFKCLVMSLSEAIQQNIEVREANTMDSARPKVTNTERERFSEIFSTLHTKLSAKVPIMTYSHGTRYVNHRASIVSLYVCCYLYFSV